MSYEITRTAPADIILDIITVPAGWGRVYTILSPAHHHHFPEHVLGTISGAISGHFEICSLSITLSA
jgi:hypothetical protein